MGLFSFSIQMVSRYPISVMFPLQQVLTHVPSEVQTICPLC